MSFIKTESTPSRIGNMLHAVFKVILVASLLGLIFILLTGDITEVRFLFIAAYAMYVFATLTLGSFIAILYGLPMYSVSKIFKLDSYLCSGIFGALPGLVFYLSTPHIINLIIFALGTLIALKYHYLMEKAEINSALYKSEAIS